MNGASSGIGTDMKKPARFATDDPEGHTQKDLAFNIWARTKAKLSTTGGATFPTRFENASASVSVAGCDTPVIRTDQPTTAMTNVDASFRFHIVAYPLSCDGQGHCSRNNEAGRLVSTPSVVNHDRA